MTPPRTSDRLPRVVLAVGLVSLLTDMSSEMIFPLLPVFVAATLGGGAFSIGLIEGVAEATAALVKLVAGAASDRSRRRLPFLVVGYGLAGAVRPLIGLARAWPIVLLLRFADRVGKGLRGPPRDALIADAVPAGARGRAFGLHRAMDHAGAVVGPLIAFGLMGLGFGTRDIFLAAAIPAVLVMIVLFTMVSDPPRPEAGPRRAAREQVSLAALGAPFRRLLAAVVLFTLGNATDAFFLYRLHQVGLPPEALALLWSAHHVVKVVMSLAGGDASDRLSRRGLMAVGWLTHAAVYGCFAAFTSTEALVASFLAYGIVAGLTEPVEKAWLVDLVPPDRRGAGFGWLQGAVGMAALPASVLFGLLWTAWGAPVAFGAGAALALVATALMLRVPARA